MDQKPLTKKDIFLINRAKILAKKRKSKFSEVAAVLETESGEIFEGRNIMFDMWHPGSICAEYSAVASMLTAGEKKIKTIVAVRYKDSKTEILAPCGNCRQMLSSLGNPEVIINNKKTKLKELLPLNYKSE